MFFNALNFNDLLSFWEKDVLKPQYDVIILGAGFSGLWLAYFLKNEHKDLKICILDAAIYPIGASTKNAGFACFGSASEILKNINEIGEDKTYELTKKRFEGVQIIKNSFGIEAEFDDCLSYELFDNQLDYENIGSKLNYINEFLEPFINSKNHFKVKNDILNTFGFKGFTNAISNNNEGGIQPVKLLEALKKNLMAAGVNIFFNIDIQDIDHSNSEKVHIQTANFGIFETRHLSVCTNAFTSKSFPEVKVKPGRGQVIITEKIPDLKIKGTFHFDEGYYYFREYDSRILLGGGRNLDFEAETTFSQENSSFITDKLLEILKNKILPNHSFKIEHSWSGTMAFNESHAPVSELKSRNLSFSVAMNGMGVALAPALGKDLASLIINQLDVK